MVSSISKEDMMYLESSDEPMETRPLAGGELSVNGLDAEELGRISHARSKLIALLASGLASPFSSVNGSARNLLRVCNQLEQDLLAALTPTDEDEQSIAYYRDVISANLTGLELMISNLLELACSDDNALLTVPPFNQAARVSTSAPTLERPAPDSRPSTSGPRRLLIVDDEPEIASLFSTYLARRHGYTVKVLSDAASVVEAARAFQPHLILLDLMMLGNAGYALCRALKSNRATLSIPVVLLTAQGETDRLISGIEAGADDYLLKPVNMAELHARLELVMQRLERARQASPLTGLPGNVIIEREVESRIKSGAKFAVCYSDLANFKAFNDVYGYVHGDRVINFVAQTIASVIDEQGGPDDFVGHVGGDDFVFITAPPRAKDICNAIITCFDRDIPSFYNASDRAAGYITAANRSDVLTNFPIITISIAVVTNTARPITSLSQVSEVSSSIKRHLKTRRGSHILIDRRGQSDGHVAVD